MRQQEPGGYGANILPENFLGGYALHFQQLLDKLPAGAYTCDRDGLITYYNDHAVEIWGRAPRLNDPVDRFCGSFKLFTSDGAPMRHNDCWMAQALITNRPYNGFEVVIEQPGGIRLTALAHANPIHDESGNLIGAVNVLIDITERKQAENALRELNRSKNEFIATLAHELRNPLSPIRNAVRILQTEGAADPEKTGWAVEVIDRQTQQMTRLIDDLLDLARITSNKLELRQERLGVAQVLDAAAEVSRPRIEKRGQNFHVEHPPEKIYVRGDLTRLAQVVGNLLNNASKYTAEGGDIYLSTGVSDGFVRIVVRDTGIGMDSEVLPRIFDMFTQADEARERSGEGLGIGLTLARRLVKMHGGTLEASSAGVNQGSTFVVSLPVEAAAGQEEAPRRDEPEGSSGPDGTRILVVDDNVDSANSLGMLLSIKGNDVRQVYDGAEAVDVAAEFDPRIIFLDIGMPQMDGYEAARRIRAQETGGKALLIALTGWGQAEDRQRSKEAGFDHHLTKPLDFDELEKLLAEHGF